MSAPSPAVASAYRPDELPHPHVAAHLAAGSTPAAVLLDEALAELIEACDVVGIPPEEWHSPQTGPFDPDSSAGYIGVTDATGERPAAESPLHYYSLRLYGPPSADPAAAAGRFAAHCTAGGWVPSSDFTSGLVSPRRTVFFTRPDGARCGLEASARESVLTYESPRTTDPDVLRPSPGEDGEGPDPSASDTVYWRGA